jgi:uncharacterized iron-regulated membrane protein
MITKRLLFSVHKYCGLAAALFILIQAMTGSMLVYRTEVAQFIDRQGMVRHSTGPDAPLSIILHGIQRSNPAFEIQRLAYPQSQTATYFAHMVSADGTLRYASVDPGDGRILRSGSIWSFPVEAALFIHFRLMTGRAGLMLVLLTGFSILTLATTGLIYWWPRRGRFGKALTLDLRLPPRVVLRQFHRSLGVVISSILLLSATTGLFVGSVFLLASGPLYSVAPTGDPPRIDPGVDSMLALARAQFPGRAIRDIRMPGPQSFNVYFLAPERNSSAVHTVRIDLASRRVVAKLAASDDSSLWVPILPIHNGELFGTAGRVVILCAGLALAVMALTGPLMWLQRSLAARKKFDRRIVT